MPNVPLSLRIDAEIKERIEQEAKSLDRSSSYVVLQAISSYLKGKDEKRKAIAEAIAEADKGVFISQESMGKWVDSWGTDNELPPPEADIYPSSK
ncbi:MAG: Unknown protein [uncultured Thiotrichaceae bacterium]|uniref:Ribbon-helix-helix protein CopG domain-containing protein n=1 Tax=uncultured Thiotrichaceae bacterium TaxID=298394 RepID=A0A6S6TM20_9GAMM|nr:MAG: Unknown protein [uncultured Thiotrichaceae bacterium]